MAKKISPFVFRNISSEDSNGMGPYEGVKEARAKESGPRRIGRLPAKLEEAEKHKFAFFDHLFAVFKI